MAGTYSFDDPYSKSASCSQCESTQETCLGGSKIAPKPGYWRYDIHSASVLECPETKACQYVLIFRFDINCFLIEVGLWMTFIILKVFARSHMKEIFATNVPQIMPNSDVRDLRSFN